MKVRRAFRDSDDARLASDLERELSQATTTTEPRDNNALLHDHRTLPPTSA